MEPRENIIYTCSDCSKTMYPRAGTFTLDEISHSNHVKANFGREHMWVKVDEITHLGVKGTVANQPERPSSPPYGAEVIIEFEHIEDIANF